MKKIIFILVFLIVHNIFPQDKITSTSGLINFEASVPLFEEIKATNKVAFCAINLKTGELISTIQMDEFRFKLSLMEEHFNKKYLETHRYPIAYFKGRIEGFNMDFIGVVPEEFRLIGTLKIHGKTKKINILMVFKKIENKIEIVSNFSLKAKDFNIQIPEILSMKVAETVNVKTLFSFNNPILASSP